jgi:ABC-2 type transport system permease protein
MVRLMLMLGAGLAPLLAPFGVDRRQYLAILEVRFASDFARGHRDQVEVGPHEWSAQRTLTMLMHLAFGGILAAVLHWTRDPWVGLFWTFTAVMALVTLTLMTEHASTLCETQDLQVLGPLPVDGRTILAARLAHLLIFFILLVGSLGLPPLIVGTVRFGIAFAPAFLLALLLGTATCMGLALLSLVAALRFVAAHRVRTLLLLLQVLGGAGGILAWQLVPRQLGQASTRGTDLDTIWPWLLPPAHSAAFVQLVSGAANPPPIGLALLAIGIPIVLMLAIAQSATRFQERLLAMASAERGHAIPPHRRLWRDLLLRDRDAVLGYDFTAAMSARDRQFRMRAWPPLAMGWIMAAWYVLQSDRTAARVSPAIACIALYMVALVAPQVLLLARFSDDWPARDVFRTNPLQRPGQAVAGSLLALALRFTVPATLVTSIVVLLIGGLAIWPDVLFSLLVVAAMQLLAVRATDRRLPFCEKFRAGAVEGSLTRGLLLMLAAGLLAGLHAFLRLEPERFWIGMALLAAAIAIAAGDLVRELRNPSQLALHWRDERN